MVSIILTTYNRCEFLRDALQTLVEQSYPGTTQLILCDDGSRDRTVEIAQEYRCDFDDFQIIQENPTEEQRLREVRYVKLINRALSLCKEKYITYATDDDLYHPLRMRQMVEFLEIHPDIYLLYHYMKVFKVSKGKDFLELIWDLRHPWDPGLRYWIENIWNYIDHSSFMHRNLAYSHSEPKAKNLDSSVAPLPQNDRRNIPWDDDPRYMRCGDWGFIRRALARPDLGGFAHIPEYLAVGRKIEGMSVHFDGVERYLSSIEDLSRQRRPCVLHQGPPKGLADPPKA